MYMSLTAVVSGSAAHKVLACSHVVLVVTSVVTMMGWCLTVGISIQRVQCVIGRITLTAQMDTQNLLDQQQQQFPQPQQHQLPPILDAKTMMTAQMINGATLQSSLENASLAAGQAMTAQQ